jgi:hypothetical protein
MSDRYPAVAWLYYWEWPVGTDCAGPRSGYTVKTFRATDEYVRYVRAEPQGGVAYETPDVLLALATRLRRTASSLCILCAEQLLQTADTIETEAAVVRHLESKRSE